MISHYSPPMAVYRRVVRRYKVGDHVGLELIRAVGEVLERRGVGGGFLNDEGQGTYLVRFLGVSEPVHFELAKALCRCRSHSALYAPMGRRSARKASGSELMKRIQLAMDECESSWTSRQDGSDSSRIWYESESLLNCSGKERLPMNVNTRWPTPPPHFPLIPLGHWDPTTAPRYARGTQGT